MDAARRVAGEMPRPKVRTMVCPYCGGLTPDTGRCTHCEANLDALSRQATQNQMGPWFVRDERSAFRPGCSYSTIRRMAESGTIRPGTVVRGPSTHQFWMLAKHTPGVAHLMGMCHNCGAEVSADMFACRSCGEPFSTERDRQHLGLGPARSLPGSASAEAVALHAEPAPGAERVDGPAIDVGGVAPGRGAEPAARTPRDEGSGRDGDGVVERVESLNRQVMMLRRAWRSERQRAWVSMACAGAITLMAVLIVVVT